MKTPKANELPILEAMRQGVDYHFEITCRNLTFRARPLSTLEVVQAAQKTADRIMLMKPEHRLAVTESLFSASETLKMASTSDIGATDATLTDHYLERMTPDEIQYLFKQYIGICDKVNPALDKMPREELEALVEGLKKKKDLDSALTEQSFMDLVNICRHYLTTSEDSQTASSSG